MERHVSKNICFIKIGLFIFNFRKAVKEVWRKCRQKAYWTHLLEEKKLQVNQSKTTSVLTFSDFPRGFQMIEQDGQTKITMRRFPACYTRGD